MGSIQTSGDCGVRVPGDLTVALTGYTERRVHVAAYLTSQGGWGVIGGLNQNCPTTSCEEWCSTLMELRAYLHLLAQSRKTTPRRVLLRPSPAVQLLDRWQNGNSSTPPWHQDTGSRTLPRLMAEVSSRPKAIIAGVPVQERQLLLAGAARLADLCTQHIRHRLTREELRKRATAQGHTHLARLLPAA